MEFNNPYYNKIIDLFYIRFGEIEDKNNTISTKIFKYIY